MRHGRGVRLPPCAAVVLAATFWSSAVQAVNANCSIAKCGNFSCPDIVLTSQADADAVGKCGNFSGSVIIQNNDITSITLTGFESIYPGSLIISNCSQLADISAPNLAFFYDNFTLSNLPLLTNLSLPALSQPGGLIWDSLPLLTNALISNGSGYGFLALSITNTALNNIDFYVPHGGFINDLTIKDNPNLNNLNFTSLKSAEIIEIVGNGLATSLLFPDLSSSEGISIQNVGYVDMSALAMISPGGLNLTFNSFDTFSAPALSSITTTNSNTSLNISGNSVLRTLDLPALGEVGGWDGGGDLVVADNPLLHSLVLPELGNIAGAASLTGDFSNVSIPSLIDIMNTFFLNSTGSHLDCTFFDEKNYEMLATIAELKREGSEYQLAPAPYSCYSIAPGSTKDTARHYHPPKKPLSKGAEAGIAISAVVLGLLFTNVSYRWWRKRHPEPKPRQGTAEGDVVNLDDMRGGVVRAEDEDGDHPPKYARVGVPGEVPPDYDQSLSGSPSHGENTAAVRPETTTTSPAA